MPSLFDVLMPGCFVLLSISTWFFFEDRPADLSKNGFVGV